eukprot:scaffold7582_cov72-Phaeocystis_antarctica.AAC.9
MVRRTPHYWALPGRCAGTGRIARDPAVGDSAMNMHAPLKGGGVCVLLQARVRVLRPQDGHVRP